MNSLRTTEIMQYPNIDILQGLATEGDSPQEEGRSSAGFQRSTVTSGVKAEKEKKKRTRVTPEQLVHLERYFAMDRNPTAARRKDISDLLGMQERQTQIWFQNRYVRFPFGIFHSHIIYYFLVARKRNFKTEKTLSSWTPCLMPRRSLLLSQPTCTISFMKKDVSAFKNSSSHGSHNHYSRECHPVY